MKVVGIVAINAAYLRAFHAVAETGQFTAAARVLSLTQSTLSNQVASLESRYRVRLFDRTPRGVLPTPVGERLYELTRRQQALTQQAEQLLLASNTLDGGFVRVGGDAPQHVMPVLARLKRAHPELTVSLQMGNSEAMLARLAEGRSDVAIVGRKYDDSRFVFAPLTRAPLVCFVALAHGWAGRGAVTLADITSTTLILRESRSETRRLLEHALAVRGLAATEIFEVEGREAVREAVAAGLGVGIVSAAEFDVDPRIIALTLSDADLMMTEYIACLAARRRLSVVEAFFDAANPQQA
jgi:LysR family transcriptional regulator, low CO2-responsive transcriptional regulator